MTQYVNKDDQRRVWPALQDRDGRTLELGAGETVNLDLSSDFVDEYLKPRFPRKETKAQAAEREQLEAEEAQVGAGDGALENDNEKEQS